ncbi:MAG: ion transporter, partial [Candidatus Sericytochromatia bacterium]
MALPDWYTGLRHQVDRLMNDPAFPPKRRFDNFIFFLILVSVMLLIEEFVFLPSEKLPPLLFTIDTIILIIFAIEYALRLWVVQPELPHAVRISWKDRVFYHVAARVQWMLKPMHLVDLVAILPLFPFLRSLRILRILRLFTHVDFTRKLFRYFNPFEAASQTLRQNQLLYLFVASFIAMAVLLGAATGFIAEHRVNANMTTPFDALYWAIVTLTTVGYGDITPQTVGGRVVSMALMLTGFVILALVAGVVSQTMSQSFLKLREEGIRMTAMVNHVIICGWNRHTPMLLQEIRQNSREVSERVVVFAARPQPEQLPEWVTYVEGDPTQEVELGKVRFGVADAAIVVADEREGTTFSDADARTLLTVFTIRAYERKLAATGIHRTRPLHITAELLDPDNLSFLRQAGADEIIQTARFGSSLLAQSAATPASGELLGSLLGAEGGLLRRDPPPEGLALPMAFWEVASTLKREYDQLPLGLERNGRLFFNPAAETMVQPGDRLLYLASGEAIAEAQRLHHASQSFWGA